MQPRHSPPGPAVRTKNQALVPRWAPQARGQQDHWDLQGIPFSPSWPTWYHGRHQPLQLQAQKAGSPEPGQPHSCPVSSSLSETSLTGRRPRACVHTDTRVCTPPPSRVGRHNTLVTLHHLPAPPPTLDPNTVSTLGATSPHPRSTTCQQPSPSNPALLTARPPRPCSGIPKAEPGL